MSTVAQILSAIVARHAAVPQVGKVHDYERYSQTESKFREFFVADLGGGVRQLRGWWWRRTATRESSISTGTTLNVHTWECRGYMAVSDADASEKVFSQLVEDFRTVIRDDPTLGGVCEQNAVEGEEDGVQVTDMGPVMFCGVLCHCAVLQLKTWSYL